MGLLDYNKPMCNTGVSASDPGLSKGAGGGARNIKCKAPQMVAIFFIASFNRNRGGGHGPLAPPPGSAAGYSARVVHSGFFFHDGTTGFT